MTKLPPPIDGSSFVALLHNDNTTKYLTISIKCDNVAIRGDVIENL